MAKKRVEILYHDPPEETIECDRCDKRKPCAHIRIFKDTFAICQDCLQEMANSFVEGKIFVLDRTKTTEQEVVVAKIYGDYLCRVRNPYTGNEWDVMRNRLSEKNSSKFF